MHTAEERKVYKYHNGVCDVFADPLLLRRQLRLFSGEDLNKLASDAEAAHRPDASQEDFERGHASEERLVNAIRQAFGLAPIDPESGQGFSWADCLHVYNAFCDWLDQKKTTPDTSPTS